MILRTLHKENATWEGGMKMDQMGHHWTKVFWNDAFKARLNKRLSLKTHNAGGNVELFYFQIWIELLLGIYWVFVSGSDLRQRRRGCRWCRAWSSQEAGGAGESRGVPRRARALLSATSTRAADGSSRSTAASIKTWWKTWSWLMEIGDNRSNGRWWRYNRTDQSRIVTAKWKKGNSTSLRNN